jgi:hypothetical protein
MSDQVLDELLQKAVALYVPALHREAALTTFRMLVDSARATGASLAVSTLADVIRKQDKK